MTIIMPSINWSLVLSIVLGTLCILIHLILSVYLRDGLCYNQSFVYRYRDWDIVRIKLVLIQVESRKSNVKLV